MARVCQVTGKRPVTGNNVSHAKTARSAAFCPTFTSTASGGVGKAFCPSAGVQQACVSSIKNDDAVLADMRARGEKV